MSRRRRRSRRSYVVEFGLAVLALVLIVAAFYLGWFEAFGRWFSEQLQR